jgi:PAS domain S-box-containing protein
MSSEHRPVPTDQHQTNSPAQHRQLVNSDSQAGIDYHELEEALYRSRAELAGYRTLYENTPCLYFTLNSAGIIVAINQFGAARLGYSVEELIGTLIFDRVAPQDQETLQVEFLAFLNQVHPVAHWEFRYLCKDGHCLWVKVTACVMEQATNGTLILFAGEDISDLKRTESALQTAHNELERRVRERTAELEQANTRLQAEILDRQRAQEELHDSEAKFRHIYENSPVMMHSIDESGIICNVNRKWLEETGYTREEVIGHRADFLLTPESAARAATGIAQFWRDGYGRDVPYQYVKKDGTVIDILLNCDATTDPSGKRISLSVARNVTQQKQAEEALRKSEACYRAIVEDQTELICRFLPTGILTFVNEAYCRYFGKRRDELIDQGFKSFVFEEDQALVSEHLARLSTETPTITLEHRVVLPSGELRWQQWTNRAVLDEQGRLIEFQSVGRDITQLKQVELSLAKANETLESKVQRRTEELIQAATQLQNEITKHQRTQQMNALLAKAVEYAGDAIGITDSESRFQYVNPAFERVVGYSCAEIAGKTPAAVLRSGQHSESHYQTMWNTISSGHVWSGYLISKRKDGSLLHQEATVSPVHNSFGVITHYVTVRRDITERQQAEEAVRVSEARFRAIFEQATIGIGLTTPTGQLLETNSAWQTMLGYTAEELHHMHFWEYTHPDDVDIDRALYAELLAGQRNFYQIEKRYLRKDGQLFWGRLTVSKVPGAAGETQFAFGMVEDITERKHAEEALLSQLERERLIMAIAHRIRQSLNLGTILNTTVNEVRELIQVDRVLIYRVWGDGTGSAVMESVVRGRPSVMGRSFPEEVFPQEYQQLYCQGRVRAISDVETEDIAPCLVDFLQQFEVRAKLVVPILQEKKLWGLLVVHQCSRPRQWHTQDIDLLKQLATQLAIAIQQSELYQQVKLFNANLECQVQERTLQLQQALTFEALLKRITDKVRDSLDEDQILQTAVQELAIGLNVECCDNGLYDLAQATSTMSHEYGNSVLVPHEQVLMVDHPEIYRQLLQGQCFQLCKWHPVRGWMLALTCPILDDQGVLGDLWLFKQPDHACVFTEVEIRLVQQVANQCAIAIRQARLYKAAQAQVEELEKLHRLKDDFLSTVSHELRSPVANMKMAIQMLELTLSRTSEPALTTPQLEEAHQRYTHQLTRYLQILRNECKREIELINDLLDLQRLEAGGQQIALSHIPLQTWLLQVVKPFQERTQTRQQVLQVDIDPDIPLLISDMASLERILAELLTNACKYTPAEETIVLTARMDADIVEICVRNFGTEIPASELPRIFDKFYRVPHADPWKQGGTGLGLALVKKLTEHLNGTIQVESAAGQTCFRVKFPLPAPR